jgi:hypothetical protein
VEPNKVHDEKINLEVVPPIYRSKADWLTIYGGDVATGTRLEARSGLVSTVSRRLLTAGVDPGGDVPCVLASGMVRVSLAGAQVVARSERKRGAVVAPGLEVTFGGEFFSHPAGTLALAIQLTRDVCAEVGGNESDLQLARVDWAVDMAGMHHAELCGHGSLAELRQRWSGPARRRDVLDTAPAADVRLVGAPGTMTAYIGSRSGRQTVVYRKDIAFKGSTKNEYVEAEWRGSGWNGIAPVTRCEVRMSRRWMMDRAIDGRKVVDVPITEIGALVPRLAAEGLREQAPHVGWWERVVAAVGAEPIHAERIADTVRASTTLARASRALADLYQVGLGDTAIDLAARMDGTGRLIGAIDIETARAWAQQKVKVQNV